jgi:predicted nucleic acid-binding protein
LTATVALDTSVAIPLVVAAHDAHAAVVRWWAGRQVALSGHAVAETYAVLTRLPGDLRLTPTDAARLMTERFAPALLISARTARRLPQTLARWGIAGGATYDALVALAALDNDTQLATRDARARATYERLGTRVLVVG